MNAEQKQLIINAINEGCQTAGVYFGSVNPGDRCILGAMMDQSLEKEVREAKAISPTGLSPWFDRVLNISAITHFPSYIIDDLCSKYGLGLQQLIDLQKTNDLLHNDAGTTDCCGFYSYSSADRIAARRNSVMNVLNTFEVEDAPQSEPVPVTVEDEPAWQDAPVEDGELVTA